MSTRPTVAVLLAVSMATGATVRAGGSDTTADDVHRHLRHTVRHLRHEVRQAVRAHLGDARHQVRRALRQVQRELREAGRGAASQSRERDARAFRQIAPTDDPCAERRDGTRGSACEVRDTRLSAPASPLAVDASPNGGIRVEAWDQPDVLVRAVVHTYADTDEDARALLSQVRVTAAGARVEAGGPDRDGSGWRRQGWSVSFRIWAPRQVALDLTAHNGGVALHGMRGESRFETVNGGITLDDVGGRVEGRTSNGGVTVRLAGARWDGAGLDLQTTNGGVSLVVPRDYSAALEVSTVNGGVRSDLPLAVPEGRRKTLRTTLGSGGPLLRVQTVNGGVRLDAR